TEGYYIKVSGGTTLSAEGLPVALPFNIPLSSGWNIASYPASAPRDAVAVVQPLIDAGYLVKVQDEAGHAVENVPGIGIVNTIGDFNSGEGYYIKVSTSTSLTIAAPAAAKTIPLAQATEIPAATHFSMPWQGHPYKAMNIYLLMTPEETAALESGWEIGVFDGDLPVGAAAMSPEWFQARQYLPIVAGMDDPLTAGIDGFVPGRPLHLRIWDGHGEMEVLPRQAASDHGGEGSDLHMAFVPQGTAVVPWEQLAFTQAARQTAVPEHYYLHAGYPNPFNAVSVVRFDLPEDQVVELTVYNLLGEPVRSLASGNYPAGSHRAYWDAKDNFGNLAPSGIYFYKFQAGPYSLVRRVLYLK
ncbi:MAG: T9SS type A sorting domain-containing protein, partial [Fidelibacterota bacterium]